MPLLLAPEGWLGIVVNGPAAPVVSHLAAVTLPGGLEASLSLEETTTEAGALSPDKFRNIYIQEEVMTKQYSPWSQHEFTKRQAKIKK